MMREYSMRTVSEISVREQHENSAKAERAIRELCDVHSAPEEGVSGYICVVSRSTMLVC